MTEPFGFPARFASNCRVLTSLPTQSVHVSDWAKLLACGDASGEVETVNLRKKQSAKFVSLITCVPTVSFRLQTLGLYIKEGVFGRLITGGAYIRGGYNGNRKSASDKLFLVCNHVTRRPCRGSVQ